jgi:hypothetical protein
LMHSSVIIIDMAFSEHYQFFIIFSFNRCTTNG